MTPHENKPLCQSDIDSLPLSLKNSHVCVFFVGSTTKCPAEESSYLCAVAIGRCQVIAVAEETWSLGWMERCCPVRSEVTCEIFEL